MKKGYISGILFIIIGLLIAIGPFTIFRVCDPHESDMIMKCYRTARAELGLGIVIAVLGAVFGIQKTSRAQTAVSISIILNGLLAYLIPNVLIGVCDGIHMHCHAVARPSLSILSAAAVIIAVLNILYSDRKRKGADYEAQGSDNR